MTDLRVNASNDRVKRLAGNQSYALDLHFSDAHMPCFSLYSCSLTRRFGTRGYTCSQNDSCGRKTYVYSSSCCPWAAVAQIHTVVDVDVHAADASL
jgi:hypothetical protein